MSEQISDEITWYEVQLVVPSYIVDPLSDALLNLGALSVSVEDADAGTELEQPVFAEPGSVTLEEVPQMWPSSRLLILVERDFAITELLEQASLSVDYEQLPQWTIKSVQKQDWVRLTQSQFNPIALGKNIWIVPSWHKADFEAPEPVENSTAVILQLDPGLAFGTGNHPTTRMCIEWLELYSLVGKTVLDYGCGSGILALLCAKLGAKKVLGVDIDQQALQATRENASNNQCVVECFNPNEFESKEFDVVVANILAKPLQLLAPLLSSCVKQQGHIVLSGILSAQAEEIIATYQAWINLHVFAEDEGWVLLVGKR